MSDPTGWEEESDLEPGEDVAPSLYYQSLPEFIREFFIPMFPRDITNIPGLTWCPKWWLHPEAAYRLDSLWRSWEHLRLDAATGSSSWLREHLDHHLPLLISDSGPFKGCSIKNGHAVDRDYRFPVEEPPEGLYADQISTVTAAHP